MRKPVRAHSTCFRNQLGTVRTLPLLSHLPPSLHNNEERHTDKYDVTDTDAPTTALSTAVTSNTTSRLTTRRP